MEIYMLILSLLVPSLILGLVFQRLHIGELKNKSAPTVEVGQLKAALRIKQIQNPAIHNLVLVIDEKNIEAIWYEYNLKYSASELTKKLIGAMSGFEKRNTLPIALLIEESSKELALSKKLLVAKREAIETQERELEEFEIQGELS